ncbi:MAG: MFS transporter, partial [Actinobacteria bacterium]|nr:MFS transporter [Actinomycetota bacterium]
MSSVAVSGKASRRLHRAWLVAGVTFLVLLASAAFRSSVGLLIVPFEEDFGWSRSAISLAVSVNLVFYGVTAPFAAALMERFGIRNIAALALSLIALGTGLTLVMNAAWQLVLLWGVIVGLGTGSTALVFGALVANRWFTKNRGLVMGILGAAWATGSLVFLPLLSNIINNFGWRYASLGIALMCLALIPIVWIVIRDRPSDIGLRPFGSSEVVTTEELTTNTTHSALSAARTALSTLAFAAKTRAFWLLAGTFFICGWTTNGIISTHFVPAAHDHGMGATTAAGLLAIVGIFDIIGTLGSGWLTDRVNPRILLGIYYGFRGVALIALPVLLGPNIDPPIVVVMILFGLDWVATVPPTATLCREIYGSERGPIIFGWVFAAHMIGAAFAASASSVIREQFGDYSTAWFLAGALALIAAVAAFMIPRRSF